MKYKGKKRKVKNPLIWANWKLREQLNEAKHEIAALERKKSEFFTVSLALRNRQGFIDFTFIKTFHTLPEALLVYNFIIDSLGTTNGEIRVFIENCQSVIIKDYQTPNFHPKTEREVKND